MKYEELIITEVPQDDSTSYEEKMILYEEIKKIKPNVVVETGTHRGLTTLYMLHALWENGKGHLHTADPFEWGAAGNFRKFPELERHVTYYQKPGKDLVVEGIDFMFIDGFHEKHFVLEEIDALFPYLNPGAVVYFHDTNGSNIYCDVPGAIDERGLKVEYLKTQNGMAKYVHKKTVGVDAEANTHKAVVGKDNPRKGADKLSKPQRKNGVAPRTRKSRTTGTPQDE